jgi:hypothetical protein
MQRWGWSCAQNKCGFGKLPIGRAFVMNGGDGQTKITYFKIQWYLCHKERKSLVVNAISLLVISSIYWVLGEIGMAHLRSKDAKQSFDFFDKLQVGSLTKHEVKCAFISLFGKPPSQVFPSYIHCFPRFVSFCICINDGKLMIMNFSLKIVFFLMIMVLNLLMIHGSFRY